MIEWILDFRIHTHNHRINEFYFESKDTHTAKLIKMENHYLVLRKIHPRNLGTPIITL